MQALASLFFSLVFFLPGRNAFMVCGEIVRIRLPRGSDGLPKGTAFVQYSSEEEVVRPEVDRGGCMMFTMNSNSNPRTVIGRCGQ